MTQNTSQISPNDISQTSVLSNTGYDKQVDDSLSQPELFASLNFYRFSALGIANTLCVHPFRWVYARLLRSLSFKILFTVFVIAIICLSISFILSANIVQEMIQTFTSFTELLSLAFKFLTFICKVTKSVSIYTGQSFFGALTLRCYFIHCGVAPPPISADQEIKHATNLIATVSNLAHYPNSLNTYSVNLYSALTDFRAYLRIQLTTFESQSWTEVRRSPKILPISVIAFIHLPMTSRNFTRTQKGLLRLFFSDMSIC